MRSLFIILFFSFCIRGYSQEFYLFIGTYTGTGSKGIYVYRFNAATGKATWLSNTENIVNPSFLTIAPDGKIIYACTETRTANAGSVSSFRFDRSSGQLSLINKQNSGGDNPVYISVHKNSTWVVAGNYSGGSLSAFKINPDGSLKPFTQSIKHTGKGPDTVRQTQPHVHSVVFSPDAKFLFVPDLGLDKIMIYKFNEQSEQPLQPAKIPFIKTGERSGPRHFTFHPNRKWGYLVEEMKGEVTAYNYKNGKLILLQRVSTHADTLKAPYGSADIHISPDGNFLYVTNRASENNIAIFSIAADGELKLVSYESVRGKTPRNFIIDPSGNFLLIANQDSDNIVIFKRNKITGSLQYTGNQIDIPVPVCLQMMK